MSWERLRHACSKFPGNLRLLYSEVSTWKLDGTQPSIKPKPLKISKLSNIVKVMDINEPVPKTVKNVPKWDKLEVLEAEEIGIQCPRRCNRCSNCSDYSIFA